jgi:hypothetical protein
VVCDNLEQRFVSTRTQEYFEHPRFSLILTMTVRRKVSLPEEVCAAVEQRFGARFQSLESLLEFVLREIVRDDAEVLDRAEQQIIEKRLRDLGYK